MKPGAAPRPAAGDQPHPFGIIWTFKQSSYQCFTRFTQKDTLKLPLNMLKAWHRGLSRGVGLAVRA
jgi:2,3-bisphosphoglycerate-independent phosphoglycerate mutase